MTLADICALDSFGAVYVTGRTGSLDFPMQDAYNTTYGGGNQVAIVFKLNPSRNELVYSTYIGGSGEEDGGLNNIFRD
jgi:hypothetical protein